MSKFDQAGFVVFGVVFCVTWLWTWQKRQLWRVDRHSHTGLIFFDYKRNVFSLDLKTVAESLSITVFDCKFQTVETTHQKARVANVVVVDGWHSVVMVDCRLWPCCQSWVRRRRKAAGQPILLAKTIVRMDLVYPSLYSTACINECCCLWLSDGRILNFCRLQPAVQRQEPH